MQRTGNFMLLPGHRDEWCYSGIFRVKPGWLGGMQYAPQGRRYNPLWFLSTWYTLLRVTLDISSFNLSRRRRRPASGSLVTCWTCGQPGHFRRATVRRELNERRRRAPVANSVDVSSPSPIIIILCRYSIAIQQSSSKAK